jgi:hypothetical protein
VQLEYFRLLSKEQNRPFEVSKRQTSLKKKTKSNSLFNTAITQKGLKKYLPTVEVKNKRLLPTLSQRKPAMIATTKLKIFKMPF